MKKVNLPRGQNTEPTEVQNTSNTDERKVQDLNSSHVEDNSITPVNDGDDCISDGQDIDTAVQDDPMSRASQDDNY